VRYTVTEQRVDVLGELWMGGQAATTIRLSPYDLENLGDAADRDAVESWLAKHSGDFASVTDFRADFHLGDTHVVHEWEKEDSEGDFGACMLGEDY